MSESYDICTRPIQADDLEARMRVFMDIKKELHLNIHVENGWCWCDRDDAFEHWHTGFETAWAAILDATEPYFDEDSEE